MFVCRSNFRKDSNPSGSFSAVIIVLLVRICPVVISEVLFQYMDRSRKLIPVYFVCPVNSNQFLYYKGRLPLLV